MERVGAGEGGVFSGGDVEELVGAEVHDYEVVLRYEAYAVGAGGECLVGDVEGDLGDEVGLVGLLDSGGVAGGID